MKAVRSLISAHALLILTGFLPCPSLPAQAQADAMRQWTNLQGRSIQAALVNIVGDSVVLRLVNGSESTVPLASLSEADRNFVRSSKPSGSGAAGASTSTLEWPKEVITVDPKSLVITPGEQNEKARQYHYNSGTFEFIANAPLAGTVASEVASDFELLRQAYSKLPWGWEPTPRSGAFFQIYLTETPQDYLDAGGNENSSGFSKEGRNYIRFSAIGLKKVGAKYQYDARQKEPGAAVGMTARAMAWDYLTNMAPWALSGLEKFSRDVAYQSNGTIKFTGLETGLKRHLKEQERYAQPNVARMLKYMREDWRNRDNSTSNQAGYNRNLDGIMLFYYFGYLDGEGKGTGLHEYYRTAFQKRGSNLTDLKAMLDKLTVGRDDAKLGADMKEKFAGINVKVE